MEIDLKSLKKYKFNNTVIRGIYYLFNKWELVYVGQSDNILRRLNQHTDKEFDEFSYFKVDKWIDLERIEAEEINKYLPKYNKSLWGYNHKNKIKYMFNLIRRLWHELPPANYKIYNMNDEELVEYLVNSVELNRDFIEYLVKCRVKDINKIRKDVWPKVLYHNSY